MAGTSDHYDVAKADARLRHPFEGVRDLGLVLLDRDGIVSTWNAGAERISGFTASEAIGQPLASFYPPEDVAAGKPAALLDMVRSFGRVEDHGWRVRKDGSRYYADVVVTAMGAGGRVEGFTTVIRDVTSEWREARSAALLQRVWRLLSPKLLDVDGSLEALARVVVPSMADACIVDVQECGFGLCRVHVACADPVVEAKLDRIGAEREPTRNMLLERVLRTGVADRVEVDDIATFEAACDDEHHRALVRLVAPRSLMLVPLAAEDRCFGVVSFASRRPHDDADLKLAIEVGRAAGQHLENARRYGDALRSAQARDDVIGTVAHDLRDPINAIALEAHVLDRLLPDDDAVAAELREGLMRIQSVARNMARLVDGLLDVARIAGANASVRMTTCTPRELVAEPIYGLQPLADSKGVELVARVDTDLPLVCADRLRIQQVISNLVANAIKFTPPAGQVVVAAEARDGTVSFDVRDTGPGIPPDDLPHVFDRYWQGQRVDARGVGLGLSICKQIVESHGGAITVGSEVGRGSTFRFSLRCAAPSDGSEPPLSR